MSRYTRFAQALVVVVVNDVAKRRRQIPRSRVVGSGRRALSGPSPTYITYLVAYLGYSSLTFNSERLPVRPLTLILVLAASLASSSVFAATLNVVGGQLLGASGVDVDGMLYNVEFLDGTCIGLYDGCDAIKDLTFETAAAALPASQGLLDQVILDGSGFFDSVTEYPRGCDALEYCILLSPYALVQAASVGRITQSALSELVIDVAALTDPDLVPAVGGGFDWRACGLSVDPNTAYCRCATQSRVRHRTFHGPRPNRRFAVEL
ncbi:MAG: hypothetical protein ACI8W3_002023 [Myxococcota bacterium]|jgi:hypothetical protein